MHSAYPGMGVQEIMETDWNTLNAMMKRIERDKHEGQLVALQTALVVAQAEAGGFKEQAMEPYRQLKDALISDEVKTEIEAHKAAARRRARAERGPSAMRRIVKAPAQP